MAPVVRIIMLPATGSGAVVAPRQLEGSQVRPMTQAASSNEPIGSGPRVRGGSVPATAGALEREHHARYQASDWVSPTVVVGLLRVADALIVLFAAIAAYPELGVTGK